MRFIKATEKDIALIQELAKNSWEHAYQDILSAGQIAYMLNTMYSYEEILGHLQHPGYHYYLMQDQADGRFMGFIGYENSYEGEEATTKLHRIYLVPGFKGRGAGKEALHFLRGEVQKTGGRRIILNVNKHNPAIKFYESQGYRVYGEGVFDIGNGYFMDDYLMEFLIHK
ncbi:GNAT family N-acetyltransferase [uncultured Chryseobacterium sp.]|uniref:GNAT family N-acetyltransferase n=1 Tax=uncultured Chryseobacterium sp. TaxID=259322 RepID=UPI0025FF6189|nr:GNAT family N-acetyltransferase [uncultured Chryseobacterium sp.]